MNPVSKFTPKIRREKTALSNSDLSKKADTVQVFCRLRPLKDDEESTCIKLLSPTVLHLKTPPEVKGVRKQVECTFGHIFTGFATQDEVFEHVAYPLLEGLLKGKNGLLFTYGVTGSGKTYTLAGDHNNPGIMPKCIHTLFNSIGEFQAPKFVIKPDKMNYFEIQSEDDVAQDKWNELRSTRNKVTKRVNKDKTFINDGKAIADISQSNRYSVFVSYVEIYNNVVYDLLDEGKTLESKILREDARKNMYVNGVVEAEVKSAEEAFELFNFAQKRKRMGNTVLNAVSSRSHSIFNIRVVQFQQVAHNEEGRQVIPDGNLLKVSQLSLVDLAGSERTNRTKNTGQLLREASQINKSLMTLRTCLEILRKNQTTSAYEPVPYRDSKLTLLLKNYFEGEGNVVMIVCVNPSVDDFDENLQVMNFAETTKNVQIAASESRYNTPCRGRIQKKTATPHASRGAGLSTIRPKLPDIKFRFSSLEESKAVLESICNVLKTRIQNHTELNKEFEKRENAFRKRLLEMQQGYTLGKSEIKSMKAQYRKEKQKTATKEAKLADMEVYHKELIGRNVELQEEINKLRNIISEKDLKITKNIVEKEKTKHKLAVETEKMTRELDAKLRRQREHLHKEMRAKDSKIQKVREILDNEVTPPEIVVPREPLHDYNPAQTPKMQAESKKVTTTPAARRRRSRSAGEVWLEHNSVKPVALGTVLQPTMKKRKSVTKLSKASDITNPKQSKYCLIAQEQDLEGEVETKVYKGDILPTCGGGAQVIFNDVEKLRQESPTSK